MPDIAPDLDEVPRPASHGGPHPFLSGGGEMGERLRAHDWASTPLGTPDTWPQGLKTTVRLMLTTRHPIFIFWGPTHLCMYNDAYRPSIGPEKHPSLLGTPGEEGWAEIWPDIGPQIAMVMRGEGATWHENQLLLILRHGELQEVYWTYSYGPIDDDTAPNGVGGVLVVCTETTALVQAEQRRLGEAQRLHALFQQAPGFMCVLRGPDHVFEIVNAAYTTLVGDRPLVGRSVRDAFPEIEAQVFPELLDRVYATGVAVTGYIQSLVIQRAAGEPPEERFVDFVYQPLRDDAAAVVGIFVEGSDVTDGVRRRQALEASESRLGAALAIAELGAFTWELRDGVVSLDDRSRDIFGFAPLEATGADDLLARVSPDDRDRVAAAVFAAGAGAARLESEFQVRLPSGERRTVVVLAEAARGDGGQASPLVGVFADNTERGRAEAERRTLFDALAHDMNTPLASLKAQAQSLTRQILRNGIPEQELLVERIGRFDQLADRMAELVRQLGEHARLAMGEPVVLKRQETDLIALLRDTVSEFRIGGGPHLIRLEAASDALVGTWDPRLLRRVATNLIGNAVKYSPDGGEILVRVVEEEGMAVLAVRDPGIGIPPADLGRVFELRRRGGNVGTIVGNGIGLAGVRQIVEQHGGVVDVESVEGEGTTFLVRLPLDR